MKTNLKQLKSPNCRKSFHLLQKQEIVFFLQKKVINNHYTKGEIL
nr:MAG TPA: hypothetical protein [Caudoviricetes sp.]